MKEVTANGMLKAINDNFNTLGESGAYTAIAGDATANELTIDTGKEDATSFDVTIFRDGVNVTADAIITLDDGVLTVADGASTYSVTAGDKVYWRAY